MEVVKKTDERVRSMVEQDENAKVCIMQASILYCTFGLNDSVPLYFVHSAGWGEAGSKPHVGGGALIIRDE